MTPVINPWVIYLISVADGFLGVVMIALIVLLGALLWHVIGGYIEDDAYERKPIVVKLVVASFLCGLLMVFVPGEKTITKMLIAQNVTYERVEQATDTVQSVYEDIMGLFEEKDNG